MGGVGSTGYSVLAHGADTGSSSFGGVGGGSFTGSGGGGAAVSAGFANRELKNPPIPAPQPLIASLAPAAAPAIAALVPGVVGAASVGGVSTFVGGGLSIPAPSSDLVDEVLEMESDLTNDMFGRSESGLRLPNGELDVGVDGAAGAPSGLLHAVPLPVPGSAATAAISVVLHLSSWNKWAF